MAARAPALAGEGAEALVLIRCTDGAQRLERSGAGSTSAGGCMQGEVMGSCQ